MMQPIPDYDSDDWELISSESSSVSEYGEKELSTTEITEPSKVEAPEVENPNKEIINENPSDTNEKERTDSLPIQEASDDINQCDSIIDEEEKTPVKSYEEVNNDTCKEAGEKLCSSDTSSESIDPKPCSPVLEGPNAQLRESEKHTALYSIHRPYLVAAGAVFACCSLIAMDGFFLRSGIRQQVSLVRIDFVMIPL